MIAFSRRELLASVIAASIPAGAPKVFCSLEESRTAFAQIRPTRYSIVESAAGFAPENLSWLAFHGITIHSPIAVAGPQWIAYTWPCQTLIRDFGRVCPISGGTVIAKLGDIPVAVRQGSLVVLGSPLGPHLYSGHPAAHNWIKALLNS